MAVKLLLVHIFAKPYVAGKPLIKQWVWWAVCSVLCVIWCVNWFVFTYCSPVISTDRQMTSASLHSSLASTVIAVISCRMPAIAIACSFAAYQPNCPMFIILLCSYFQIATCYLWPSFKNFLPLYWIPHAYINPAGCTFVFDLHLMLKLPNGRRI